MGNTLPLNMNWFEKQVNQIKNTKVA